MRRASRDISFWRLQCAGWALYALLLVVTFLPMVSEEGGVLRLVEVKTVRALIGLGLSSILRLALRRVSPGSPLARQAIHALIGAMVLGVAWALLNEGYSALRTTEYDWHASQARLLRSSVDFAVTLLGWSALYFGLKHARASRQERERALTAAALLSEARLASLRHQVHPHFLFNALTSIRALIDEEPARARRVVTEVADFLRYGLTQQDASRVPLSTELAMVRTYLAIEQVRFEEKLAPAWEVQPGLEDVRVPAFILQPLVENAVKHGMASEILPVRLLVRASANGERLRLEVANSGTWAPVTRNGQRLEGTGTGLRNVRERLAQLYPGEGQLTHELSEGMVRVVIEFPARREEHEVEDARASGR